MPNSIPNKAWTHISVDFITKLSLAQGYDSILVVVDRFTKMAYFVPTTEKTMVEGLARLFRDNVWRLHRLPESIISDRGPQCSEPTPEPELSQLLSYQRGQRELIRVPISLVCLLIHISNGLCT